MRLYVAFRETQIPSSPYNTNPFFKSQPVHGMIFLYQYQEEEDEEKDKEMKGSPPCSNHVWFANQVCS